MKNTDCLAKDSVEAKERGLSYGQLQQMRYAQMIAEEREKRKQQQNDKSESA